MTKAIIIVLLACFMMLGCIYMEETGMIDVIPGIGPSEPSTPPSEGAPASSPEVTPGVMMPHGSTSLVKGGQPFDFSEGAHTSNYEAADLLIAGPGIEHAVYIKAPGVMNLKTMTNLQAQAPAYADNTYLIRTKEGNYAQITITSVDEEEISIHFDWAYRPDGGQDFSQSPY